MYNKYVQVVINKISRSTDNVYTYGVAGNLENKLEVGKRVKIQFGKNKKLLEAIIVKIISKSNIDESKIKPIVGIIDEKPVIKKELIKLAFWMRNRYLCKYIEALRCMLPSNLKYEQKIYLKICENSDFSSMTKKESQIFSIISSGNKDIDTIKKKYTNQDLYSVIDQMCERGIIEKKFTETKGNIENKVKVIELIEIRNNIEDYNLKRAKKQKEIITFLLQNNIIELNKLLTILPTSLSVLKSLEEKGLIKFKNIDKKDTKVEKIDLEKKKVLNYEQYNCFQNIISSDSKAFLIHGVTGSGKTEVYMQLIDYYLTKNLQAIVLVPEISLTPQTIERFNLRFGSNIAIYHSRLTNKERYLQWKKVLNDEVDIIIGARSALFAPMNRLGIIIIDEEHEESYKSSSAPKYDAIETAIKRAYIENCKVVLGSATPSVRSYYLSKKDYIKLTNIKNRVEERPLPEIEVIDMRKELACGNKSLLSKMLYNEIKKALSNKEQVILFLNRRGYANFVSCRKCGEVAKCDRCDISMTYHADKNVLLCHYCGKTKKISNNCFKCGSNNVKPFGIGTQQVENTIKKLFKNIKVERMDFDTMKEKGRYEQIYNDFKNQDIDILIGTQMLAKGLDFPNVTVVGIISADLTLNLPFFNANEKTYQLITQVSGRAGRGNKIGKVYVQTFEPNNFTIESVKSNLYNKFMDTEINLRKEFAYPPFIDIINIGTISKNEKELYKMSFNKYYELENEIKDLIKKREVILYKPIPNSIYKINNEFRMNLTLKSTKNSSNKLKTAIRRIYLKEDIKNIKISINFNNILNS